MHAVGVGAGAQVHLTAVVYILLPSLLTKHGTTVRAVSL